MRHGTSGRRQRNRNNNNNGGSRRGGGGHNNRAQVFDSNGPDVRIRGTAYQVAEKYLLLAKDSASAGDRILEQSYLQHAEHYQRIINSFEDGVSQERSHRSYNQDSYDEPQQQPAPLVATRPGNDTDLSLPASILGVSSQAEVKENSSTRTAELTAV